MCLVAWIPGRAAIALRLCVHVRVRGCVRVRVRVRVVYHVLPWIPADAAPWCLGSGLVLVLVLGWAAAMLGGVSVSLHRQQRRVVWTVRPGVGCYDGVPLLVVCDALVWRSVRAPG